ncbi:TPA: hypothetical protein ACGZ99_003667 [Elizabethkingia anophelis]
MNKQKKNKLTMKNGNTFARNRSTFSENRIRNLMLVIGKGLFICAVSDYSNLIY